MTRPAARTLRAALFAIAALGAATLATAPAAQAHHFHVLGISNGIGDGYSGIRLGRSCGWLHHKAVVTGDTYWWDRYEACRYGY